MKKLEKRQVMKKALVLAFMFAFVAFATSALANTFTPTNSTGVYYSINNSSGFFTTSTGYNSGLVESYNTGSAFLVQANTGSTYSDAGIVLYFNGGLKLGNLTGVSVAYSGGPLALNLWLDTGGDGQFFSYDSSGKLTSLNGDSYGGHNGFPVDDSSQFYMLGGNGAGNTYTLADLKAGTVSGISADTPLALWIGVTDGGGTNGSNVSADISSVTVATTPIPGGLLLLGAGLLRLGRYARRKRSLA